MATTYTHPTSPERSRRGGSLTLVAPAVLCLAMGIVHLTADTFAPPAARMITWGIGCLAVAAAARYLRLGLFHRLPLPEFALLQGYLVWGLPTITDSMRRGVAVSRSSVVDACLACVLFLACALLACPVGQYVGRRIRPRLAAMMPGSLPAGGRWFFPVWFATALVVHSGAVRMLPTALRFPVYVVAGLYGVLVYVADRRSSGTEQKPDRTLLWVAVAFAAVGMLSGMLIAVLLPLAAAAVLSFMSRRKVPWRWFATGLVLFAILNPAKHVFRAQQNWHKYDKTRGADGIGELVTDPIEGTEDWLDALATTWGGDIDTSRNTEASIDRFNDLSSVARAIEYTGRRVPYNHGEQWKLMPLSFVPRVLYPEKPDFTVEFNDRFNLAFGIKTERSMRNSTFLFPVIADGYWNFGWLGVTIVGAVVGFYWGLIANLWLIGHWGLQWLTLGLFATYNIMDHLYGQIGGLPQTIVGVAIASWGLSLLARMLSSSRSEKQGLPAG